MTKPSADIADVFYVSLRNGPAENAIERFQTFQEEEGILPVAASSVGNHTWRGCFWPGDKAKVRQWLTTHDVEVVLMKSQKSERAVKPKKAVKPDPGLQKSLSTLRNFKR